MSGDLNARIGRTTPAPMFGVLVGAHDATADGVGDPLVRWRGMPPVIPLLAGLVAALWPHWAYTARRLVDGSDEPWGILAALTVLALLIRDRRVLSVPTRSALVVSGLLAVIAAVASLVLPDLAAAAIAMLALGVFLLHALRDRPSTPLIPLLLLALPVVASLQFYLGYWATVDGSKVKLPVLVSTEDAIRRDRTRQGVRQVMQMAAQIGARDGLTFVGP